MNIFKCFDSFEESGDRTVSKCLKHILNRSKIRKSLIGNTCWKSYSRTFSIILTEWILVWVSTKEPQVCCEALTAECLACSMGMTVEDYCMIYPEVDGCRNFPYNFLSLRSMLDICRSTWSSEHKMKRTLEKSFANTVQRCAGKFFYTKFRVFLNIYHEGVVCS